MAGYCCREENSSLREWCEDYSFVCIESLETVDGGQHAW